MGDSAGRLGRLKGGGTAEELAAAVAHDLNNALTGIYGGLDFAAENLRRGTHARIGDDLAQVREAADRVLGVVSALEGRAARAGAPRAPEPLPDAPPAARSRRVLIIDDEPACAELVAQALPGHHVVGCASPRDALARVALGEIFDAVLCDLLMDDLDGVTVYEAIRVMAPDLAPRVVLMSGGAVTSRARAFLDDWAGPTLGKPFSIAALRDVLGALLH